MHGEQALERPQMRVQPQPHCTVCRFDLNRPNECCVRRRALRMIVEQIASFLGFCNHSPFGCDEALHADHVAAAATRLILVEAGRTCAPGLRPRFGSDRRIEVRTPGELWTLPECSIDLLVMNLVAQYLARRRSF